MDTRKKVLIGGGVVGLVILILGVWLVLRMVGTDTQNVPEVANQEVVTGVPVDITLDFFESWLEAVKSTSTNPYQSEIAVRPFLSPALKAKLEAGREREATEIDPVLCQTTIPERISARVVSSLAGTAQVLVLAKGKPEQAVFTLKQHNEGWYIDDIICSFGESTPDREFTFEREGYLLKSVPPPLDPQYWHIVFEENNQLGHFAALFFNEKSTCTSLEGTSAGCDQGQFVEAKKVRVFGQATESGVDVARLEFVKE